MSSNKRIIFAIVALMLVISACGAGEAAKEDGFVIGVSNTLVGNGWREQMICSIKAEAAAKNIDGANATTYAANATTAADESLAASTAAIEVATGKGDLRTSG